MKKNPPLKENSKEIKKFTENNNTINSIMVPPHLNVKAIFRGGALLWIFKLMKFYKESN